MSNTEVMISENEQARSRMKYAGKLEHSNEIKHGAMNQKKVERTSALRRKTAGTISGQINI